MKKYVVKVALIAVVGAAMACMASAEEKKGLSIKECMACQNKMRGAISSAVKGEKWDDAAKSAKTWLGAAEALGKNDPPKGDAKSWKEHTEKYVKAVKEIEESASKKDADKVTSSLAAFGKSCGGCHGSHKPK